VATIKKIEIFSKKTINILGLRNAVYYKDWEFVIVNGIVVMENLVD
jgi:hypothetical protein